MEARLSQKIRNISFLLLIMVACIHGYNENLRFADGSGFVPSPWLSFLERFISDGVCRVAVPLFFAISGYLACESTGHHLNAGIYGVLLKKRVFSLLIPYLLVSASGIALVFLLQLIPFSRPFFNNYNTSTTSASDWIRIWLLNPVPFQLWFIRYLMNYFIFFPILYFAIQYLRELVIGVLFLFWAWTTLYYKIGAWKIAFSLCTFFFCLISGSDIQPYISTQKNELEGLFFFGLGMYASIHHLPMVLTERKMVLPALLLMWLVWVAYRTLISLDIPQRHNEVHYHLIGFTLLGTVLVWYCYDVYSRNIESWNWLNRLAPYSFGVFLFHEPMLTVLKKGIAHVLGAGDFSLFISFLASPLIAFLLALWFSVWLAGYMPRVYRWFTGNRNPVAGSKPS
jgi:peptidoglycan/LPS O-acetylase OafA/YrhL